MENYLIYLDTCCFNRPFDNQSDDRNRLESDAILTIINKCEKGTWKLLSSDILFDEISCIANWAKKYKVLKLYNSTNINIELNDDIVKRAKELTCFNIKSFDALHIASAEYANADIFLTTDKKLINLCKTSSLSKELGVKINVKNPIIWLMEVFENGE